MEENTETKQPLHPFKGVEVDEIQRDRVDIMRESYADLYDAILRYVPQCAERTLAIRKLEEIELWTTKAIYYKGERYL